MLSIPKIRLAISYRSEFEKKTIGFHKYFLENFKKFLIFTESYNKFDEFLNFVRFSKIFLDFHVFFLIQVIFFLIFLK